MTFKKNLIDNPQETETIFFNKDTYDFSQVFTVDWCEIHEYYNLDRMTFAYKVASPFVYQTNPTIFKNIKDDAEYDVSRDERYIDERQVLYKVEYPNEYGTKSGILLVIPAKEWEPLTDEQREQYVAINCYVNLLHRKCVHRTWADISRTAPLTGETFNWVWFRKPGSTKKISTEPMKTWINHNPELTFVLWTDFEDTNDVTDVFGDDFPFDKVTVKYMKDTLEFIGDSDDSFYKVVQERVHERILVAKTDYLRTLILDKNGGFYCDLNDCVCFSPIRHWFHESPKRDIILPCDTYNSQQISNYFVYVKKGSKRFHDLHIAKFKKFSSVKRYLCDPDVPEKIAKLYLSYALKFMGSTKGHPVKEIVKMMLPDSGVFNMKLREAITQDGFSGFKMCDVRARVFFPMYVFKYLRDKDPSLGEFYDFMSEEFLEIRNIEAASMKIHYSTKDHDDSYDTSSLKSFEKIVKDLENDKEFYEFMFDLFVRNMVFVLMNMTNFTLGLKMPPRELVPFGFFLTGASVLGHYGQGTSLGILD